MQRTYLIELSCRHTRTLTDATVEAMGYVIEIGAIIQCERCLTPRRIITLPREWRIQCATCKLSRKYGASSIGATQASSKHLRANPGHLVVVLLGNRVVSRARSNLPVMFNVPGRETDDDLPPY